MQSRFQPGTIISDRFRLERPLGEGASGEVWRAVQLPMERPVAIKLLKPSSDHFARQRFDREARALASINHPSCVALYDFGHLPGDAGSFLVTELIEGETLRNWMEQPRSAGEIVHVCQQIVGALDAAHRRRVLHRDLKPENIMVARGPQAGLIVKVVDFGLSKILDDERRDITKTGEIFGTPGYMSPEQLRGLEISGATDLYSFGVILYELLQGQPPYHGPTAHRTCMMHLTEPIPVVTTDVPKPLAHLASRLLAKDPKQRPGGAEVARILGAVAAGVPGHAPPRPTAAPRPDTLDEHTTRKRSEASNTRPVALLFGGSVAAAMVGAIILSTLTNSEDPAPAPRTPPSTVEAHSSEPTTAQIVPEKATSTDAASPAPAAGCGLEAGTHRLQRRQGLTTSWALLGVPESRDESAPLPLLVLMHEAAGQDPIWFADKTAFFDRANEHGFAVLAPDGNPTLFQSPEDWEDVWSWISYARQQLCSDNGPVFLFGYGAGGWAAENMPCVFDGITATVSASHRIETTERLCEPKHAVPHLAIFPLNDPWDPVDGSSCPLGEPKQPLSAHRGALLARHGCNAADKGEVQRFGERHTCTAYACSTPLSLCEIEAGRPWPGLERPIDPCQGGRSASDFPYDDVVWNFLTAQQ